MPNVTTCSRCGNSPAHRVEVSVAIWNVAAADQPTATVLGADACAEHQEPILHVLFDHAVEMLREQAPLHAEAVALAEKRDRAGAALKVFNPIVAAAGRRADEFAAANPGKPAPAADTYIDGEHRARIIELTQECEETENARVSVIVKATAASDAIQAKLDKALKRKK